MAKYKAHGFEAQLLRWAVTSNGGATVTLQLANEEDLEPFRLMTLKSGKQAGQRLMVAASMITDDEKEQAMPKPEPKPEQQKEPAAKPHFPAGLTGLAIKWCKMPEFREWLAGEVGEPYEAAACDESWAKSVMCDTCGIKSRKELDTSADAAAAFRSAIMEPFKEVLSHVEQTAEA